MYKDKEQQELDNRAPEVLRNSSISEDRFFSEKAGSRLFSDVSIRLIHDEIRTS